MRFGRKERDDAFAEFAMTSPVRGALPYGPATVAIRRFLVALAALDLEAHDDVVARFEAQSQSAAFSAADLALGETIERSGRTDARDALFGPLLQLVRDRGIEKEAVMEAEEPVALDAIAEPALAALMGILVNDLLSREMLATLYGAFAKAIPLDSVLA